MCGHLALPDHGLILILTRVRCQALLLSPPRQGDPHFNIRLCDMFFQDCPRRCGQLLMGLLSLSSGKNWQDVLQDRQNARRYYWSRGVPDTTHPGLLSHLGVIIAVGVLHLLFGEQLPRSVQLRAHLDVPQLLFRIGAMKEAGHWWPDTTREQWCPATIA